MFSCFYNDVDELWDNVLHPLMPTCITCRSTFAC